jgi:hypothetical protein
MRRDPIDSAAAKVRNPTTDRSTIRWAAWKLFDSGEFDLAAIGFERLVDDDTPDLTALTALIQIATDRTDFHHLASSLESILTQRGNHLTPTAKLAMTQALFDIAPYPSEGLILALHEAMADVGHDGWQPILDADRRERVEAALPDGAAALPILEQWLYAPASTVLPNQAISRLEYLGCHGGIERSTSREIERLLHLVGAVGAAYRVEGCRRAALQSPFEIAADEPFDPRQLVSGQTVAIAGGHPALRSLARHDLLDFGIAEVREIPSAWEAVRDGREVGAVVAGCDLVVIVTRQIAHSTSDQIKKATARFDIPLLYAETATAGAIRRSIERWAVSKSV